MKKIFTLFVMLITAVATFAAVQVDAELSATFNPELTKYNLVFNLDVKTTHMRACSIYMKIPQGVTVSPVVARGSVLKVLIDEDDEESGYLFVTTKWSNKSQYSGYGVWSVYCSDTKHPNMLMKSGEFCKFTVTLPDNFSGGKIHVISDGSTDHSEAFDFEEFDIDLGGTAAELVKADKKSTKVTKYLDKNGKLVIEKGDKKYTAQGVETK